MRRSQIGVLALGCVLVLLAGCSGQSPQLAEQQIVAWAPAYLGAAESYQATVQGVSGTSVAVVELHGVGVTADPTLTVDPLTVSLRQVRYQPQPFRVTAIGSATFTARITEAAVNRALRQQGRADGGSLHDIRVAFERNQVRVTATAAVMNVNVPVVTTGRLRVQDGLRIIYEPQTIRVVGVGVPAFLQGVLVDRINLLVDLSGLRFVPLVEQIVVSPGAIALSGTARLPALKQ